ncbi:helix-turn-helix domain-containing protein [Glycomyces sp. NPDC048151]|uniref:helix-turn-helix domain-containing protein n=1 Tax=Glycomyces sp. NPDC048151 TaxID=3364002 RepID=UPI0037171DFE
MKRAIGPTVPRWELGDLLRTFRLDKGLEQEEAAKALACSKNKIQNMETGASRVIKAELDDLLELYGVQDAEVVERCQELRSQGDQRGWWSKHGRLPKPFAEFLGIESAAVEIQSFEPLLVSGLFQTEAYARAHERAVTPDQTPEQVEKQVKLRMERQQRVLEVDDPPEVWAIFGEAVLHQLIGGHEIMKGQLQHLVNLAERQVITLRIAPFSSAGHPGTLGNFKIFSFDEDLHSAVAYVESQAGSLYMEKPDELHRLTKAYNYIRSESLGREDSLDLLQRRIEEF